MIARAPHQRLDTIESRKISLAKHLKHSNWTSPTPYISFTNSPATIQDLVNVRAQRNRGSQTLTVIYPNTRLRKGLPILDVAAEWITITYKIRTESRINTAIVTMFVYGRSSKGK